MRFTPALIDARAIAFGYHVSMSNQVGSLKVTALEQRQSRVANSATKHREAAKWPRELHRVNLARARELRTKVDTNSVYVSSPRTNRRVAPL